MQAASLLPTSEKLSSSLWVAAIMQCTYLIHYSAINSGSCFTKTFACDCLWEIYYRASESLQRLVFALHQKEKEQRHALAVS